MYRDNVIKIKKEIIEEYKKEYISKPRIYITTETIVGRLNDIEIERITNIINDKFREKAEITKIIPERSVYSANKFSRVYIKVLCEKTGIDKEIEELENKLKELKAKKRKKIEEEIRKTKIKKLEEEIRKIADDKVSDIE